MIGDDKFKMEWRRYEFWWNICPKLTNFFRTIDEKKFLAFFLPAPIGNVIDLEREYEAKICLHENRYTSIKFESII